MVAGKNKKTNKKRTTMHVHVHSYNAEKKALIVKKKKKKSNKVKFTIETGNNAKSCRENVQAV